jgi:hypothetical protein
MLTPIRGVDVKCIRKNGGIGHGVAARPGEGSGVIGLRPISGNQTVVRGGLIEVTSRDCRGKGSSTDPIATATGNHGVGRPRFNDVERSPSDGRSLTTGHIAIASSDGGMSGVALIVWSFPPPIKP